MKQTSLRLLVVFALFIIAAAAAAAQVLYGSIVGAVEDPSGSVVPNAIVGIVNKQTGATREARTDEQGRFTLGNVPAGRYDLNVSATGFRPAARSNIEVTINTVTRQDIKLEVGSTTETVTVLASAVALQTDKSDVRAEITSAAMTQLPLPNYRNYQSLINLVPGATPAGFQNAVVDTPARALTTNINGTARNNNNTTVDGAVNIYIWLPHHTAYVPPIESIENVNISTGSFDAEQGMAGGAAITVATKSGTNQLHGSLFEFHNNQHLISSPYFKTSTYVKPLSIFNQGGGTIGGPIKKDKLFYFFSFEKTWERTGNSGNYSVPPPEFREGDFSKWTDYARVYDPASASAPSQRTMFPNNTVPKSRFSPIFDAIQRQLPQPNQISPTDPNNLSGNYFASGVLKLDRNNYDVKTNWQVNRKLMIWGSYSRMDAPVKGLYVFGDLGGPAIGTDGFGDTTTQLPRAGYTYTFSPTFLMDAVFGYTRFDQVVDIPGGDKNVGLDVWKIPGTNGGRQYASDKHYGGVPPVNFGFSNVGVAATWAPLERNDRSYTLQANFSKITGSHEFRWGFEPRRHQLTHWQPETGQPRGEINFGSGATNIPGATGRSPNTFASALMGLVSSYSKSIQFLLMKNREWQYSWYFRDNWKMNRRLTLNLGLRYEYFPLINRDDRGLERWDPYTNIVTLGGIGNIPRENGITVSKKLFAPRVGFALRMTDNFVIRSGYGITYDPLPFSRPLRGLYPATLTGSWGAGDAQAAFRDSSFGWFNNVSQGIPDVPTPDISSGRLTLPLNLDMGPRSPWGGELHRGYIQSWNFTVERKLPLNMVGDVAYVGTRTVHQLLDRNINTAGPGSALNLQANLPLAKLYGRTNGANMWDGIGDGSYHALQASLNKNIGHGLFLKGAYTLSKTLNMADEDGWAGLAFTNWEPEYRRNYAPAGYDRRQMFTMAWVYDLPVGKGKAIALSGLTDQILGGWKISGIFSAYTGTPFTVSGSGSATRCVGCPTTAEQIAPVRKIDTERGPGKPYYDPNSFRDPLFFFDPANPVYRQGSMGRNALYGPGFWRLDPMISKEFVVTERVRTEFRAEAVNITNTPSWGNPNGGSANLRLNPDGSIRDLNNFMAITGAGGLRTVRFGLRMQF